MIEIVDCPECDGTGDRYTGPERLTCPYCGGRGKLEQDVEPERVKGDDQLKVEEEDLPDGKP